MFFGVRSAWNLAKGILFRTNPAYVQYYVTARCNLTCKQCNIIFANADVREATTEEADRIAEHLKAIGTAIVLLTGGEPYIRKDLPEIVRSFERRGIHVRVQTNGLAVREQLEQTVLAGCQDISISLDSLLGNKQDFLNGSHRQSWLRAMETIALVTQTFPPRGSFAAFGTVLSPHNILEIPNIIRFATAIGWHVSLVPAHISTPSKLFNFRSYDREMIFRPELYPQVDRIIEECKELKRQGHNLYDSFEYLDNVRLFIRKEPIRWRRRNGGECDSPRLYFAIRPNGDVKVCCDHALRDSYPVWHEDFPKWYREGEIRRAVAPYTLACTGCMYGSFPEISITSHYPAALVERVKVFSTTRRPKPWPFSLDDLLAIAERINREHPIDHAPGLRYVEPGVIAMREVTYPVVAMQRIGTDQEGERHESLAR